MLDHEYQADLEQRYREAVVYPRAERRAEIERQLALITRADGRSRRAPVRWLGNRLVGMGSRLVSMGEHLSSTSMSHTATGT